MGGRGNEIPCGSFSIYLSCGCKQYSCDLMGKEKEGWLYACSYPVVFEFEFGCMDADSRSVGFVMFLLSWWREEISG